MSQAQAELQVPTHVPPALVWDRNMAEYLSEGDDPFLAACRLHEGPDIVWATQLIHGRSGWMLTRHALQQEAFVDSGTFSSADLSGIAQLIGEPFHLIPVEIDPPAHWSYRRVLNPFFTPAAVRDLEGSVRATCDTLIDRFADKGTCEFIHDFAVPFPSYVFLSLVGMPIERAPQFLKWEEEVFRGATPQIRIDSMRAVMVYLRGFIAEQRKEAGTDLIKGLLGAEIDGRPITDEEVLGILYTFYVGGLDTVYSTLGWIIHHLARNPALQERLRTHPEQIPAAVDEFLRAFSVVSTTRHVTRDIDFHGVQMRAGDLVQLPLCLSGRDPRAFADPHAIDVDRKPAALTFAAGPHLCLGRQLARRELRIALEALLGRLGDFRVPVGEAYEYHVGTTWGVDRLPLEWTY